MKEITEVYSAFKTNQFETLKPEYKNSTDEDRHSIDITLKQNKRTYKVFVYAPGAYEEHIEASRFNRVWIELLRKIPSPNEDQTPEAYER